MKIVKLVTGLAAALVVATGVQAATVPDDVKDALLRALDDEYHAEAVYDAVMETFGTQRPFVNIIRAERVHSALVKQLLVDYGIDYPENGYLTGELDLEPVPPTRQEACALGVEAEKANIGLYDGELLPIVSAYPDIVDVLTKLRDDSNEKHLPAFSRCAGM